MTLGQFIKNYRLEHNISMREFGRICDISVQYISLLERGKNNYGKKMSATMDTYAKIANGIGIPINDFLGMINDTISSKENNPAEDEFGGLSESEIAIIVKYRELNDVNKGKIEERLDMLLNEQGKESVKSLSSAG